MSRIEHKYTLYLYVEKLDRHCKSISFNTLDKVKNFLIKAKENMAKPEYVQSYYYKSYIPKGADLNKYYIRHTVAKIESTILVDEILDKEVNENE